MPRKAKTLSSLEALHPRVAELEQVEKKYKQMQEREAHFRDIFDSVSDAIFVLDATGRILEGNQSACNLLGEDVFRHSIKPHFDRCLQGETVTYEDWFDYPTLGKRFMEVTYFPYRDSRNQISGVVASTRDVTQRRLLQEEVNQQKDIEQHFSALATLLLTTTDIKEVAVQIQETARQLTHSRYGFVGSVEPETGHLLAHSLTGDIWDECGVPDKSIVFEKYVGLWGWVLQNRQSIMVNDPREGDRAPFVFRS